MGLAIDKNYVFVQLRDDADRKRLFCSNVLTFFVHDCRPCYLEVLNNFHP